MENYQATYFVCDINVQYDCISSKSISPVSHLQCHCDLLTHFEVQQGVNDVNEQVHEENERE